MRHLLWLFLPAIPLCWPNPSWAADLTKIDRTIAKEPAYKGQPKYCLLVFGPEAKTRVWLVIDGDVLYADRNGNGDLTEASKQIRSKGKFEIGTVIEADGKSKHTDLTVYVTNVGNGKGMQVKVNVEGKRVQFTGYPLDNGQTPIQFADSARTAPVVHFNGPLTLRLRPGTQVLRRTGENEMHVEFGIPGLGDNTFVFVQDEPKETPLVEIDYGKERKNIALTANY